MSAPPAGGESQTPPTATPEGTAGPWAWVTGASGGIGRACAWALARSGHRVAVLYGHNVSAAQSLIHELEHAGHPAVLHSLDLAAGHDAIAAQIKALLQQTGTPWALVHNAGVAAEGLLSLTPAATWDRVLAVNLGSFWDLMRPVARAMLRARAGRIVTMASLAGVRGNAGQCAYAASKAGLIGASKSLALELAPRGITVNAVAPGYIDTAMTAHLPMQTLCAQVPMARMGTAEEVAAAVDFLCSPAAGYITGQVLGINGGLYT